MSDGPGARRESGDEDNARRVQRLDVYLCLDTLVRAFSTLEGEPIIDGPSRKIEIEAGH